MRGVRTRRRERCRVGGRGGWGQHRPAVGRGRRHVRARPEGAHRWRVERGVCARRDGPRLGIADTTLRLWDRASGDCTRTLTGHTSDVMSVAFAPDSSMLASASADNTIRLWDPVSGESRRVLEGHTDWVRSVAFSRDGRALASGSDDKTVRLWDPASGACAAVLEGHTGYVYSVAFSPDGRTLASGGSDSTVRLSARQATPPKWVTPTPRARLGWP